jgi:hypothetical protein
MYAIREIALFQPDEFQADSRIAVSFVPTEGNS